MTTNLTITTWLILIIIHPNWSLLSPLTKSSYLYWWIHFNEGFYLYIYFMLLKKRRMVTTMITFECPITYYEYIKNTHTLTLPPATEGCWCHIQHRSTGQRQVDPSWPFFLLSFGVCWPFQIEIQSSYSKTHELWSPKGKTWVWRQQWEIKHKCCLMFTTHEIKSYWIKKKKSLCRLGTHHSSGHEIHLILQNRNKMEQTN